VLVATSHIMTLSHTVSESSYSVNHFYTL